jgi:hypothetical protein
MDYSNVNLLVIGPITEINVKFVNILTEILENYKVFTKIFCSVGYEEIYDTKKYSFVTEYNSFDLVLYIANEKKITSVCELKLKGISKKWIILNGNPPFPNFENQFELNCSNIKKDINFSDKIKSFVETAMAIKL